MMQITIVESEIKAAIRNHILGMISVREDMRIEIDLRATRGEEGFTSVVDIFSPDEPGPKTETKPKPKTVIATAAKTTRSEPKADPKPKVEAEPKAQIEPEIETVVAVEAEAEQPEPAPEKKTVLPFGKKDAEAAPAPTGEAPKSIFASLNRPVNTPTTPPAAANG